MLKLGINGFGRIGRTLLRLSTETEGVKVVGINDLCNAKDNAHLFKYDSVHGVFKGDVKTEEDSFFVNGDKIKIFKEREPKNIDWSSLGVDIVIESTGFFTDANLASAHLGGSVKKVIISAPGKNEDLTVVLGVNEDMYDAKNHNIVSNASCTTNCLAPFVKVLNDNLKVKRGMMTTIHSYTNDQKILDQAHKDMRRARAGALSMIPTSTGAAKAIALVLPELKGKLNGFSLRVPTPNVSVVDLVVEVEKETTVEEVNSLLKRASETSMSGILGYSEEPLVSMDYNGNKLSSTIDALSTMVIEDNMIKVLSWYDNETGYASRCLDLALFMAKKGL